MRRTLSLLTQLLLGLMLASTVQAVTRYTGQGGGGTPSDNNTCAQSETKATRRLTIAGGLACMAAGDTLLITTGTYGETIDATAIPAGINAESPTIVQAEHALLAIIKPVDIACCDGVYPLTIDRNYITVDGLKFDGTFVTSGLIHHIRLQGTATGVVIKNCEITGGKDTGQAKNSLAFHTGDTVTGALIQNNVIHDIGYPSTTNRIGASAIEWHMHNSIFERNHIYNVSGYSIHMFDDVAPYPSGNTIRWNRIHHNADQVLFAAGGVNNLFYGNLVYNNGGRQSGHAAVQLATRSKSAHSSGNHILNNVVYANQGPCIAVGGPGLTTDPTVQNNICYGNSGGNTIIVGNAGGTVTNTHNLEGKPNPRWVNVGAADFHLQADSPAINAGAPNANVAFDSDGIAVNATPEQGAYVYEGAPRRRRRRQGRRPRGKSSRSRRSMRWAIFLPEAV